MSTLHLIGLLLFPVVMSTVVFIRNRAVRSARNSNSYIGSSRRFYAINVVVTLTIAIIDATPVGRSASLPEIILIVADVIIVSTVVTLEYRWEAGLAESDEPSTRPDVNLP